MPELVREPITEAGRALCAELFAAYGDELYAFARAFLGDDALAEDAVQEAFLKVARSAASLDPERDPRAWLYAIVRNAARDVTRRAAAARRASALSPRAERQSQELSAGLESAERRALVEEAARDLDEDQRAALLAYARGLTQAQIGELLGCSPPTAKKRLRAAMGALTRALARRSIRQGDEL